MPNLTDRPTAAPWPARCTALVGSVGVALSLCGGCLGFSHHPRREPLPAWAERAGLRRVEVQAGRYIGLSDVCAVRAANGARRLYVVPERQRALLELEAPTSTEPDRSSATPSRGGEPPGPQVVAARPVARAIEGVPPYLDTESLAGLGNGRFVVGTEAPWPNRTHDDLLLVTLEANAAHVTGTWRFDYAPFHLSGASNAGIEGLCSDGVHLLAASETCGELPDGGRFAPLGRRGPDDERFVPLRLRLTSDTGRISALACRPVPELGVDGLSPAMEVVAIERHYGVSRLLHFVLPPTLEPLSVVTARMALDLTALVRPLVNYEGVAWLENDDLLLLADNSIGFATGPTEGLVVPAAMVHPARP